MIVVGVENYEKDDIKFVFDDRQKALDYIEKYNSTVDEFNKSKEDLYVRHRKFRDEFCINYAKQHMPNKFDKESAEKEAKELHEDYKKTCKEKRNHNHPLAIAIKNRINEIYKTIKNNVEAEQDEYENYIHQAYNQFNIQMFKDTLNKEELAIFNQSYREKITIIAEDVELNPDINNI